MTDGTGVVVSDLLLQRLEHSGWIEVPANGMSMYPFIKPGDVCRFSKLRLEMVRPGEVLLFRAEQKLIAHRFIQVDYCQDGPRILCKGDGNLFPDLPIAWANVIGVLTLIRTPRHEFRMTGLGARLWSWMIMKLPLYSRIVRRILR